MVKFHDSNGEVVRGEVYDTQPGRNPGVKVTCLEGRWKGKRRRVNQELRVLSGQDARTAAMLAAEMIAAAGQRPDEAGEWRESEMGAKRARLAETIAAAEQRPDEAGEWRDREMGAKRTRHEHEDHASQVLSGLSDEQIDEIMGDKEIVELTTELSKSHEAAGAAGEWEQVADQEQNPAEEATGGEHDEAAGTVGEREQAANLEQNPAEEAMAVLTATALHVVETLAAAERSEKLD